MNELRTSAENIGVYRGFYNRQYNGGGRLVTSGAGYTDRENDDAVIKLITGNKKAGPFGELYLENRAKVIRYGDTFTVHTPGFYIYRNMRKRTKGKFSVILFTRVGTFDSWSIYDKLDRYGDSFAEFGIFGENELFSGEEFERSTLKCCIPYGGYGTPTSPVLLVADIYGQTLYTQLMSKILGTENVEEAAEEVVDEIRVESEYALFNGYIPVFASNNSVITVKSDGTVEDFKFPYSPDADPSSVAGNIKDGTAYWGRRSIMRHWNSDYDDYSPAEFIFYDEFKNEIVWCDQAQEEFAAFCDTNQKVMKASFDERTDRLHDDPLRDLFVGYLEAMSPIAFKEYMNDYFKKKGLPNLEVTEVWPAMCCGGKTVHDWDTGHSEFMTSKDMGYYIEVAYNGKKIIGGNSGTSFSWLAVKHQREKDRVRLIHSSRCQHISSWSKHTTDQGYAHWEISDWITGPMAEESRLKIGDCPAVFMGRDSTGKSRKKLAMETLRARMANL